MFREFGLIIPIAANRRSLRRVEPTGKYVPPEFAVMDRMVNGAYGPLLQPAPFRPNLTPEYLDKLSGVTLTRRMIAADEESVRSGLEDPEEEPMGTWMNAYFEPPLPGRRGNWTRSVKTACEDGVLTYRHALLEVPALSGGLDPVISVHYERDRRRGVEQQVINYSTKNEAVGFQLRSEATRERHIVVASFYQDMREAAISAEIKYPSDPIQRRGQKVTVTTSHTGV